MEGSTKMAQKELFQVQPSVEVEVEEIEVFHFPECSVVARIKDKNVVFYDSEPAGKHIHNDCPQ